MAESVKQKELQQVIDGAFGVKSQYEESKNVTPKQYFFVDLTPAQSAQLEKLFPKDNQGERNNSRLATVLGLKAGEFGLGENYGKVNCFWISADVKPAAVEEAHYRLLRLTDTQVLPPQPTLVVTHHGIDWTDEQLKAANHALSNTGDVEYAGNQDYSKFSAEEKSRLMNAFTSLYVQELGKHTIEQSLIATNAIYDALEKGQGEHGKDKMLTDAEFRRELILELERPGSVLQAKALADQTKRFNKDIQMYWGSIWEALPELMGAEKVKDQLCTKAVQLVLDKDQYAYGKAAEHILEAKGKKWKADAEGLTVLTQEFAKSYNRNFDPPVKLNELGLLDEKVKAAARASYNYIWEKAHNGVSSSSPIPDELKLHESSVPPASPEPKQHPHHAPNIHGKPKPSHQGSTTHKNLQHPEHKKTPSPKHKKRANAAYENDAHDSGEAVADNRLSDSGAELVAGISGTLKEAGVAPGVDVQHSGVAYGGAAAPDLHKTPGKA